MEKYLQQLIKFKTVSAIDNAEEFRKLFDFVDQNLKDLSLNHQTFESNQVISHLWSTDSNPELLLTAHVDVVPASDSEFEAKVEDDKLYGRGAIDMKFAVAIFIEILKTLPDLKSRSIGLLLTSDEETGGKNGTEYVLNHSNLRPKLVLLPDAAPNMKVEQAEKGVWHVRLVATGQSAHGSRPWLGQNAIDELIAVYQKLSQQFPNPKTEQWQLTINAGKISGGTATNVVADEASLDLDIRCPDSDSLKKVKQALEQIIQNHPVTIETVLEIEPYALDSENLYLKEYLKVGQQVLGQPVELYKTSGASDARFYTQHNIPAILHSPLGGNHHSANEWLDLKSLKIYQKIMTNFITNFSTIK